MSKKKSTPEPVKPRKTAPAQILPALSQPSVQKEQPEDDYEEDETEQEGESVETEVIETDQALATTSKGLVTTDPLKRYLLELKKIPSLSSEEEVALTKRMFEHGDRDAAKRLVSANLKVVVRIAYEYRSMYHNLLDLIQEGNLGLMKAVSKFDPTKGARLGYYATWWIRSYILKYLLDNFRLVRVGTSQAQKKLFYHLMREKQRLEAQGIVAGPKLLAERLDVREKDVIEMEQRLLSPAAETSIDTPRNPDDPNSTLSNLLVDLRESADLQLERAEWLRILADALPLLSEQLNEKEQEILDSRILSDDPKTLQEVADQYGLTRERVRQLEVRVIEKLKKIVAHHLDSLSE